MQAKDITITLTSGEKKFEVLSPAGAEKPAEYRLADDSLTPTAAPYLSVKAGNAGKVVGTRKVSILLVVPVLKDGVRVDQSVMRLEFKASGLATIASIKEAVEMLTKLVEHDSVQTALKTTTAPN